MDRTWPKDAERELIADACNRELWLFLKHAMGYSANPSIGWMTNRVHKPWVEWMQAKVETWLRERREGKQVNLKMMVVIPRFFGKSMLTTKGLQLWVHLKERDAATMTDSLTAALSKKFLGSLSEIMKGREPYALFTWLYGNWYDKDRKWRSDELDTAFRVNMARSEPSFSTCSVEIGATGYHPDLLILDDPISFEKLRMEGNAWIALANQHVASMMYVLGASGAFIIVGTRYRDDDVIGTLIDTEGVSEIAGMPYPDERVQVKPNGQWALYFLQAAGDDGKSICHEVISTPKLNAMQAANPLIHASQMMNEPGTGGFQTITPDMLATMWIPYSELPKGDDLPVTIHCDTAFRFKKRFASGDWTVIEVWGHYQDGSGKVVYIDGDGDRSWSGEVFFQRLVAIVKDYRRRGHQVRAITDEMEMGGKEGAFYMLVKGKFAEAKEPCPAIVMIRRHTGARMSKEDRITAAANMWAESRVRLVRGSRGSAPLASQMLRIGATKHDDWADAAADVFDNHIYHTTRQPIQTAEDIINRYMPWQEGINPGARLTDEQAAMLYDQHVAKEQDEEWRPLEPIR